jgi:hypothetical protein
MALAAAPLSRAHIEAAIQKYGPILQIHPDEKYLPCSAEWYLNYCTLLDSKNPNSKVLHPLGTQLPPGPKDGTRFSLSVDDAAKPGNLSTAKAYVNALWKSGLTYTDLQFWVFSGFNGHGTARFDSLVLTKVKHEGDVDLTPMGEHWADWEYVGLRIDNTTQELVGIILSEHGKNIIFDKAAIAKQFKMSNGTHPIVYSSLNGHANFPSAGPNFTEDHKVLGTPAGLEFNLVNACADGGKQLDMSISHELVNAEYLKGTPDEVVSPAWVQYPYRWGPEGTVIHMSTKTLGDFIKVALGEKGNDPLLQTPIILLASELLHVFVKADINGAGAPMGQSPWVGNY